MSQELFAQMKQSVMEGDPDRARAVGAFPDGKSAVMLAAARFRDVAGTNWGKLRYLEMNRLSEASEAA